MPRWENGNRENETEKNHAVLKERRLVEGAPVRMVNRFSGNHRFELKHITPKGRVRIEGPGGVQYTVRPTKIERV
jgi:hypothetical protein